MRRITAALFALAFACVGSAQAEPAYPGKPVKIIVPFPPGGSTDIVARAIGERLQAALGQPFVVDNKAGASGNIGMGEAVRSPADGYTLVLGAPQTLTINPQIFANLPFDPQKELAPIAVIASVPNVLVVTNKLPVKTPQELLAYAKANPGKLNYGSSSIGGTPHLSAEMFKAMTDTAIVHVPYKGGAAVFTDLLAGHIQFAFTTVPSMVEHIRAGSVRALAVTGSSRSPLLPDVPSMAESGLAEVDAAPLFGLIAPAGVPPAILDRLSKTAATSVREGPLKARLAEMGFTPVGSTAAEFQERIGKEIEKWTRVVKTAGIQPDR